MITINLDIVLSNIEELYNEYDKITDLKRNIDKTSEFLQKIDQEIEQVLEDMKNKEGKLQRLNLLTQIKNQLTQSYKDMISQYMDIIKQKMEVNKFLVNRFTSQEQTNILDNSTVEQQYKEIFDILDNIQRRDRSKQEIIHYIMKEMGEYFEEKSKLNLENK